MPPSRSGFDLGKTLSRLPSKHFEGARGGSKPDTARAGVGGGAFIPAFHHNAKKRRPAQSGLQIEREQREPKTLLSCYLVRERETSDPEG